jgi:hypothetical protein
MVQLPGVAIALGAATVIVPAAVAAMAVPTIAFRPIRMELLIPMIMNRSDARRIRRA